MDLLGSEIHARLDAQLEIARRLSRELSELLAIQGWPANSDVEAKLPIKPEVSGSKAVVFPTARKS